ncbi:MAG: Ig-like domain-containing protein, partial [Acidobacteriota bacterium]|nr:Ig-like domain-containing protein [Acidobacteriota bacterium]
ATTVAVTAPVTGATVSGNLTVSAAAIPGTGLTITGVQFKVDNVSVGAPVTASPYSIVLDTTTLTNGPHTLVAVAMDSSNASVTSTPPVAITVNNSGPPPSGTALVTSFTPGVARNNFTGGFGMRFTVGATPLNVTALGRIYISGNTGMHVVKLVRVSDGTDVPGGSATVSLPAGSPAGQFVYVALAAPITLDANASYYLISQETNGGDRFYDAGPVTATGAVSVNSAVAYGPGVGFIPVGLPNYSSGPVSLLYTTGP